MIDRRALLIGAGALVAGPVLARRGASSPGFADLRARLGPGGRLGLAALDTASGRRIAFDAHSRYAFCSTIKLALAGQVLGEVEAGRATLGAAIPFAEADLLGYAPRVRAAFDAGRRAMTIDELCAAIVEVSDNSAANLLFARFGGPAALTRFVRRAGDSITRADRPEPALNTNLAGDPRDTTTPAAMAGLMRSLLLGTVLRPASRDRLIGWMESASTGLHRLRAGLPAGWRAGDKTGNGANGSANDLAIAWPPRRPPILIASYTSGGTADAAARDAVHAEAARRIVRAFGLD
jgi:beta-lactamase class A